MKWIVLAAALLTAACRSDQSPALLLSDTTVELDAFSGLPNPRWQLDVAEARELGTRLSGLPVAHGLMMPEAGLGYRGFVVHFGAHERLYVGKGLVAATREGSPVLYTDTKHAEAYLKDLAQARGYGSVTRNLSPNEVTSAKLFPAK